MGEGGREEREGGRGGMQFNVLYPWVLASNYIYHCHSLLYTRCLLIFLDPTATGHQFSQHLLKVRQECVAKSYWESQGCIQKFCRGGANLGYMDKRGGAQPGGSSIVSCEVLHSRGGENDTRGGECPSPPPLKYGPDCQIFIYDIFPYAFYNQTRDIGMDDAGQFGKT